MTAPHGSRITWLRRVPTDTMAIGVPTSSSIRLRYARAFAGRSLSERASVVGVSHPGMIS